MALKAPRAGEIKSVIDPVFGKDMIDRSFFYLQPDGSEKEEIFRLWNYTKGWTTTIMGLTKDRQVITVNEFRHGANDFVLSFPGGAPQGTKTPEEVTQAEFLEECGYKAGKIINLGDPLWPNPASLNEKVYLFLGLDCKKVSDVEHESTEIMETVLFPIEEWYKKIFEGEIRSMVAVTISLLALPHIYPNEIKFIK